MTLLSVQKDFISDYFGPKIRAKMRAPKQADYTSDYFGPKIRAKMSAPKQADFISDYLGQKFVPRCAGQSKQILFQTISGPVRSSCTLRGIHTTHSLRDKYEKTETVLT